MRMRMKAFVACVGLWTVAAAACGSEQQAAPPATNDLSQVCASYQDPGGNVRGDQSLEQNRAHLLARVEVFQSIASLLDQRDAAELAAGVRRIATGFQTAADMTANDALLTQVATVTADPDLIAVANELDQSMIGICAPVGTTAATTAQGS